MCAARTQQWSRRTLHIERRLRNSQDHEAGLRRAQVRLRRWLLTDAYPLWGTSGWDSERGGFHELLGRYGPVADEPRRARVQVRQIYSFARAASLGWDGETGGMIAEAWKYFFRHYRRADGLFRTLVAPDGGVLDDRAWLYDQAFVLLALAECHRISAGSATHLTAARALLSRLVELLKRPGAGFYSGLPDGVPLLANPHMHLLEALQNWMLVDDDPSWRQLADEIVTLAVDRLVDATSGAVFERFDADWIRLAGAADLLLEPGHQFEWAWLLQRAPESAARPLLLNVARRLMRVGERYGVRQGFVVMAIDGSTEEPSANAYSVRDGNARLWSQTERLKCALALARQTGEESYNAAAVDAAHVMLAYLEHPVPGLWYDCVSAGGEFIEQPAPASTLYHIVCALEQLTIALHTSEQAP